MVAEAVTRYESIAWGRWEGGFKLRYSWRVLLDEEQEERMAEDDCGQIQLRAVIGD